MLTEATKNNLRRKSAWVDHVQMHGDVPLFSLIEINPTELCTRRCSFCPRSDPAFYPNQNLNMSLGLASKMATELAGLDYQGGVSFCGYGEPLLHPKFAQLVRCFERFHCEVVTSGDGLTAARIAELASAGIAYFVVSLYDGPEQVETFTRRFAEAGVTDFILRDRWHSGADDFGLKLTNRAGAVTTGNQDPTDVMRPCAYPSYQLMVDWNGDVLLCPQDWSKHVKFGNLAMQSMIEVWTSRAMMKRRVHLMRNRDGLSPCAGCNVSGDLHGFNHVTAWQAR